MDMQTTTDEQGPGIGHNEPDALDALKAQVTELIKIGDAWSDVEQIGDETQASRCADARARIKSLIKEISDTRLSTTKPLREQTDAINKSHNVLSDQLDVVVKKLQPLLDDWLKRENARLEEIARKAEEEALAALQEAEDAKAKAAETGNASSEIDAQEADQTANEAVEHAEELSKQSGPQVHGNYTGRALSQRSEWHAEITNYEQALDHFKNDQKVKDLILQLANAGAKSKDKTPIPGVTFVEEKKAA